MVQLRTLCTVLLLTLAVTAFASGGGDGLVFADSICDLGRITVDSGYHKCVFNFTNASEKPVTIVGAVSSCGCTVPTYPRDPIMPGDSGKVEVTYDSTGRPAGEFERTIKLITTGDKREITLRITGEAISMMHRL